MEKNALEKVQIMTGHSLIGSTSKQVKSMVSPQKSVIIE